MLAAAKQRCLQHSRSQQADMGLRSAAEEGVTPHTAAGKFCAAQNIPADYAYGAVEPQMARQLARWEHHAEPQEPLIKTIDVSLAVELTARRTTLWGSAGVQWPSTCARSESCSAHAADTGSSAAKHLCHRLSNSCARCIMLRCRSLWRLGTRPSQTGSCGIWRTPPAA